MWFDSGRVCLDLVATSSAPAGAEELYDGDELRLWLAGAGLVPDRTPLARVGPDWVAAFRALRADVACLVRAALTGGSPDGARWPGSTRWPPAHPRVCAPSRTARGTSYGSCAGASSAGRCSPRSPAMRWNC
ncbi:hypothetical protein SUDANB120_02406 [Streptomyces sp. enrichment culture]